MEGIGKQEELGRGLMVRKETRNWPIMFRALESEKEIEEK